MKQSINMNTELPFFSYGIFRPGEIPFIGIINFIDKIEKLTIKGHIRIRDGVHLFSEKPEDDVNGFLIYFKPNLSESAYKFINSLEPNKIFRWSEKLDENSNSFNLLIGKSPTKGSESIEELPNIYSTTIDPYFTTGLAMLNEFKLPEWDWELKGSFEIQMRYMFLWTIIERFTFLRYSLGGNPSYRVNLLADNEHFIKGLKKYVNKERKIFDTQTLQHCTLDADKPKKAIAYYYQVRNNLTHRGKGISKDYYILIDCYKELFNIIQFVIENTKDECRKNKEKYGRKD